MQRIPRIPQVVKNKNKTSSPWSTCMYNDSDFCFITVDISICTLKEKMQMIFFVSF